MTYRGFDAATVINSGVSAPIKQTRAILREHGDPPVGPDETARMWSHSALREVDLFHGSYRKYAFAPHFHSVPAIGIVDRGAMRAHWRSTNHHLAEGSIMLLNPGDVHAPGPATDKGWSFRVFYLENRFFETRSIEVSGKQLRFSKPFAEDRQLAQRLLRLHVALEEHRDLLEVEPELLIVLEQIAQKHASTPVEISTPRGNKACVRRAKDYIHAYYSRNVSLSDLAMAAEVTPFHLVRTFRNHIGLTPHAYVTQVRIEHAKLLLRSGARIADIASQTGFADQSHFTRHFKRLTGVTPGRYHSHAL